MQKPTVNVPETAICVKRQFPALLPNLCIVQGIKMPATIQDVARLAGVSTATVSRALRGLPNVSHATRLHVLRIAEEVNYHITPHVSRIASGRRVIGVVVPMVDQWFYSKLASVIELELLAYGVDAARYSVDSIESQVSLLRHVTARKLVDGLVLCSLCYTAETVAVLQKAGIAVVTIETHTPEFPSVGIDNEEAAAMGTRYLINLGHRRIAIISGMEDAPLQFAIPQARKRGYQKALAQNGIKYRPALDQPGNYIYQGGAEAMKILFAVHQPPTAVFAFSDEMAIGALKTAQDMKLRVPEDISIMGFDDNDVAEYVGLTTVRQPVNEFGELAVSQIVYQLDAEYEPRAAAQPEAELMVRTTVGRPPQTAAE